MRRGFAYFAVLLICSAIVFHLFENEPIAEVFGTLAFLSLFLAALAPDRSLLAQIGATRDVAARIYRQSWMPLLQRLILRSRDRGKGEETQDGGVMLR